MRGFCYLGDRVNASGGCEAAVTARARIGWVKFRECGVISGWGCATGTLEPLAYTRASSAEFCYPILE